MKEINFNNASNSSCHMEKIILEIVKKSSLN